MSAIELVVAKGCFDVGGVRFEQGSLIEIDRDHAQRYLDLGLLRKKEDAPGYKEVPGMKWVRLNETVNSVNEGESGVKGDIRLYNESAAMSMINYNIAEAYEVPNHV